MTDIVEVPPAPVVPPFPALGSNNYNDEAYAAGVALPGLSAGIHAIGVAARTNAVAAKEQAQAAVASANAATTQADAAIGYRNASQLSASSAAGYAAQAQIDAALAVTARTGAQDSAATAHAGAERAEAAAASISDGPVTSVNGMTGVVELPLATIFGDTSLYVTQTKTYQITNYNSFSAYSVAASAGTASISGDTITFTAPGTPGSVSLTLTVDSQPTVFSVTVQAAGVAAPTNANPADGATSIPDSPTLQSSAFAAYGLPDTQLAARWTLYQGGSQVHSSGWRTDALTSYIVPAGVVLVSTAYTWTVEYQGNALGTSPASNPTGFTTAATFNSYIPPPTATPASFGAPFEGGFYAGMVWGQLTQSVTSMALATGSKTFTVPNMTSAPIVYEGQTVEVRSRANPANKFIGTVTGALGTNLTINVTSIGGSGTFSDWSVMARYRVIVAPKSNGENAGIVLKNGTTALPTACQTLVEGFASTQAMHDAGTSTVYPAAHWARSLSIGGKADWYIPARDELELCWRNLKPTTSANHTADKPAPSSFEYRNNGSYSDTSASQGVNNNSSPTGAAYTASIPGQSTSIEFRTGYSEAYEFGSSYYLSSSEYSATYMWVQGWRSVQPGAQYFSSKTDSCRVRAVRRSII